MTTAAGAESATASDLPTFMVIGAKKTGTTSLCRYLGAHPEVFFTRPKEPRFFSDPAWRERLDSYRALFETGTSAKARGEGSTDYSSSPKCVGVPARIREVVPDVKLVYLVRSPLERTLSEYAFRVARGQDRRPLVDALQEGSPYVENSRYGFQLERFLEHFALEQILVVRSKDLRDDRANTLARILEFIGVDPTVSVPNLAKEYLTTAKMRLPRAWSNRAVELAARTPLRLLPGPLKNKLYRAARRRVRVPNTTLPDDVERRLRRLFSDDLQRLRELCDVELELGQGA